MSTDDMVNELIRNDWIFNKALMMWISPWNTKFSSLDEAWAHMILNQRIMGNRY